MRNAETVLNIIRDRGIRGLPLEDVYRQLYNPVLYLRAYARLYANKGAMTPGATTENADDMSLEKIGTIIDAVRHERYRWTPVRRVNIPKSNGKTRPLGLPTWSDKLLQDVIRSILEAYYEPQFSDRSHGFRPGRGCHTALNTVKRTWTGTKWFVEGDIKGCFDNIDHSVLLMILSEKIHDNRFLKLIGSLLKAGYMEDWRYNTTYSGTPQGGVVSPILSNIYMDRLDIFIEHELLPAYNRGKRRRFMKPTIRLIQTAGRRKAQGRPGEAKALYKQVQRLPTLDPEDPNYRRLCYVRYADDYLLGFAGPKEEAVEIKEKLAIFLRETLKLEQSPDKTLITHATTERARFLGYEVESMRDNSSRTATGRRRLKGQIGLRVPADVIEAKCAEYMRAGKITTRPEMMKDSDYTIVSLYGQQYRGIVQYYQMAYNISWLHRIEWVIKGSLLMTLANKHKSSVRKIKRKLASRMETSEGTLVCLKVTVEREGKPALTAIFGGIPLRKTERAILSDKLIPEYRTERSELLKRLLAQKCEICGSTENIRVHHIRKLADLKRNGRQAKPLWQQLMSARNRKTLVVCHDCHVGIHSGNPTRRTRT